LRLALLVAIFLSTSPAAQAEDFDRADWIADFEQAKAAITQLSPNLDWALARGMDLPETEQLARTRLEGARDPLAARRVLERFIQSFGDGHMEISWPAPGTNEDPPAKGDVCERLGYWSAPDDRAVATQLPGYRSLTPEDATIEAGIAPLPRGKIGVLRIALFSPGETLCARALAELAVAPAGPCDDVCADAVFRRADNLFLREIAERIRALIAARPTAILVDVAGNGGGSDTALAIARMLGGMDLESPPVGVARGAERAQSLSAMADILKRTTESADMRAFLVPILAALQKAAHAADQPCDMQPIWSGEEAGCSNVITGPFFAGGLVATELPDAFRRAPWAEVVSATARFEYEQGLWRGPLLVLVDDGSASATELFASMLQDGEQAVIIGAPTFGAGCGWNLPHQNVVLERSGGRLAIPNCARYRRDGRNEIDGVEPDILIGFRPHDTTAQRVKRLNARLPSAIRAAGGS